MILVNALELSAACMRFDAAGAEGVETMLACPKVQRMRLERSHGTAADWVTEFSSVAAV